MQIALFCHSLRSDWNHGNAHFLRGLITELVHLGHRVISYEPADSWSASHLLAEGGSPALEAFRAAYPDLPVAVYDPADFDVAGALDGVDLALVHEWNEPALVAAIGRERHRNRALRILFHDTHHRSVTAPESMSRYDLSPYDGVLAFGESVRQQYLDRQWASPVWTFHEAADTRVFYPREPRPSTDDLVWIGNWGDDEREAELREFLIEPARDLSLRASIFGVRYPDRALAELREAGIHYRGFLPNYQAPEIFAQCGFTVHVPRRPYAAALPGVPTIRVFEALACGIPLISAPWNDSENLFPNDCFLTAPDGAAMRRLMGRVLRDPEASRAMAARGLAAIQSRHTCGHRALQLLEIYAAIKPAAGTVEAAA